MSTTVYLPIIAAVAILGFYAVTKLGRRPKDYPPGPPTLPIIGNLHQIPKKNEYLKFTEWANEYGPIYSIMVGSQAIIVISSGEVVKDLFDRRSAIYSDRPEMYLAKHIPYSNLRLFNMRYGPQWRSLRKVTHTLLGVNAAPAYVPYQVLERKQLLNELLTTPDAFWPSLQKYSGSLATTLIFGWRTPELDSPRLKKLFKELDAITGAMATGAAALLDAFPILRCLPDSLLPVKAKARAAYQFGDEVFMENWDTARKDMAEKRIRPCFCVGLAKAQETDKEHLSERNLAYTAGNVFEAAAETTADSLYAFMQALILWPEVQAKAQEEIERVVGPNRLPTMEDAPNLDYIRRVVKELVRWFPAAPLGAGPHAATRDDEYKGYKIPKGAPVFQNIWAIHGDPVRFPEPRRFNPDRFGDTSADLSIPESAAHPDQSKRDTFAFGAGRRICPGMHVADRSLFLAVSGILWAFDVKAKKDQHGNDILPDCDDLIVLISAQPAPFEADIQPRSEKRAQILREEWDDAQQLLDSVTKQWKATPEGVWTPSLST